MSISQYTGRKYDILALRGAQPTGEAILQQSLFDENSAGQICVGIQKLAQRWALEFLTETGSMTYLPLRGCNFMKRLRQGYIRTEEDADAEFRLAQLDIQRNLVNEETDDMPADERFSKAELLNVIVYPGLIDLRVSITSLAGANRQVILPISTLGDI